MPEKDPATYAAVKNPATYTALTYLWVIALAAWGGAVNYIKRVREGSTQRFNFMELVGEIMTAAFAGIITFWLCEASGIEPLVTAALVGVSGHMGSRAIYMIEAWARKKWGP